MLIEKSLNLIVDTWVYLVDSKLINLKKPSAIGDLY